MHRSEILKPLSREHHTALVHVKRILERAEDGVTAVLSYWQQEGDQLQPELLTLFSEEESLVEGIEAPLLSQFWHEHQQLRSLMASPNAENLQAFAVLVKAPVLQSEYVL
ncbi:hypothetical protein Q4488_10880 [Amphritea sp. 1_MG-2023]|uniref:hypothetical protein n=1 Tax=Amphritea sp. 1_MG-2023 TaxID=3062670 RepID=UPI0026E3EE62|nr:hypothetical protein [Amphritea sp. 1_MG-2023]MDO6563886.1 hypothetical protein [Amphritea sp. 1_MG-2023]